MYGILKQIKPEEAKKIAEPIIEEVKSILAKGKVAVFKRPHQEFLNLYVTKKVSKWDPRFYPEYGVYDIWAQECENASTAGVNLLDHTYTLTEEEPKIENI